MGIFGALTTSVAGLRAQSYALENISGNIANSQTTAFKRIDTSFLDLIPDTGNDAAARRQRDLAHRASTNTVQGDVQAASVSTYMAINGDGFFAVQKPGSFTDNSPIFDGVDDYTRRGDFTLDKSGYLVNGAGYYLEGIPIDPTTGNLSGSAPQVLKFENDFLPAQATTKVTYRANLASYPLTTKHDTSVPGSELLNVRRFHHQSADRRHAGDALRDASRNGAAAVNNKNSPAARSPRDDHAVRRHRHRFAGVDFAVGDTITVNGTTITFTCAGGAAGANADSMSTDTVGDLLAQDRYGITGTRPPSSTCSGGIVTLHSGTASQPHDHQFERRGFRGARLHQHRCTSSRTGGGTVGYRAS